MERFRKLVSVCLLSGTIAGLLLFAVQHFTTFPLIEKAEVYETAAEKQMPAMNHTDAEWQPTDGAERTLFTALTTVVTAIGFAALLFGTIAFTSISLNGWRGILLGVAAFICVDLAPAWGLPPQPPGVPVADIYAGQLWWAATVIATAVALWLLTDRRRSLPIRLIGVLAFIVPHAVGAPVATGESAVPADLVRQFVLLSILTTGMFWIALGLVGGLLLQHSKRVEARVNHLFSQHRTEA